MPICTPSKWRSSTPPATPTAGHSTSTTRISPAASTWSRCFAGNTPPPPSASTTRCGWTTPISTWPTTCAGWAAHHPGITSPCANSCHRCMPTNWIAAARCGCRGWSRACRTARWRLSPWSTTPTLTAWVPPLTCRSSTARNPAGNPSRLRPGNPGPGPPGANACGGARATCRRCWVKTCPG